MTLKFLFIMSVDKSNKLRRHSQRRYAKEASSRRRSSVSAKLKWAARKANSQVQLDRAKWLFSKKWTEVHRKLVADFGRDALPLRTVTWHRQRFARIANGLSPGPRGFLPDEDTASRVTEIHAREPMISAREITRQLNVPGLPSETT